jgi:Amidohydrolase family
MTAGAQIPGMARQLAWLIVRRPWGSAGAGRPEGRPGRSGARPARADACGQTIRSGAVVVDRGVRLLALALALTASACSPRPGAPAGDPPPAPVPSAAVDAPAGVLPSGEAVRVELDGERIAALVPAPVPAPAPASAAWLWPPIIDSHVHLTYWPVADRLAGTGIAAVVDLAAPEVRPDTRLRVISSGPMLTSPGGYPLDSWGEDGYGKGCADAACVTAAVDALARQGAGVIKLALDEGGLAPALAPVAVAAAHARRLRVAVHALSDRAARLGADAGADLLAHTPVEPLRPETIAAWRGRAVISTLAAFGGSRAAIGNLRALRAAGATVLYGTDLGNLRTAGPSADELALLRAAGLDDAAITDAMTAAPARYWGLPFGALAAGDEASLLVLDRDPRADAATLLAPRAVWLRGRRAR